MEALKKQVADKMVSCVCMKAKSAAIYIKKGVVLISKC